eukprot:CAMPEP_0185044028 /NCGR_PEP_ID=MMETSP1103-20130426/43226_2 /TAXON_ID=36769 /ORGANISM="Paraphysomonas bandaiensis, Strain Caron Lab Isolate" /LENGTH=47 /DNA_ID= /DNA_START= /DNA_END= /DNA_ORIENTATION=
MMEVEGVEMYNNFLASLIHSLVLDPVPLCEGVGETGDEDTRHSSSLL